MTKTIAFMAMSFIVAQNTWACGPRADANPTAESLVGNYVQAAYLGNEQTQKTLNAEVTVPLPNGSTRSVVVPIVVMIRANLTLPLAEILGASKEVNLIADQATADRLINDLKSKYCGKEVNASLWQYTEDNSLRNVIDSDETLRKAISPNQESSALVIVQKLELPYYHQEMDAYSMCSSARGNLKIDCK